MQQSNFPGCRDLCDDQNQRINNVCLEVNAAILAQVRRQEGHQHLVLAWVLKAEALDSTDDLDFEDIADVGHEGSNLLHQAFHVGLVTCLQQRRERQRRRIAVGIRQEGLHVAIAPRRHRRPVLRQEVERPDGAEADDGLRRGQEDLQDRHRVRDVVAEDGLPRALLVDDGEVAEGPRGLVGHHLALVPQRVLQVCHQCLFDARVPLCHQSLASVSHQEALRHGALELPLREACDHLVEGQAVGLLQVVDQSQGMELDHGMVRVHAALDLVDPSTDVVGHALEQMHGAHERGGRDEGVLVNDGRLHVAVDLGDHVGVQDTAQDANRIGTVDVDLAVHVLDKAGHADEHHLF
mmetsp:Transcript_96456/g.241881  ORF Transcript_96456/g.241881 Transcript_96456/m.241881 type:complete len:351 (+) Transcript_96456:1521-2573(+)